MVPGLKRYLIQSGVYALGLVLLHFVLLWGFPEWYEFSFGLSLIVFLFIFFALFHYILLRLRDSHPAFFVRFFMGLTAVKMLVLLLILVIYISFNRSNIIPFIVIFSLGYIGFSGLEVFHAFKALKSDS